MNKSDLISEIVAATGMSKADAARTVDALFSPNEGIISKALKKGSRVQIAGFGTFEAKKRNARTGRNPASGEIIQIGAANTATFRAAKRLKTITAGHHGDPQTDPPPPKKTADQDGD